MMHGMGVTLFFSLSVILLWAICAPEDFRVRVLMEYLNDGHFDSPGPFRPIGPYPYAFRWQGNEPYKIQSLCDSLKLRSTGMDLITAPEVGVGLQAGYIPFADICLVNLDIIDQASDRFDCKDQIGTKVYKHSVPQWVKVSTIKDPFSMKRQEIVFENKGSCLVNLLLTM